MDKRRKRFVPLSIHFAHGATAEKLTAKFGNDGLLTWVCLLAAAKRATEQGTFTYVSESEGWKELGLGYPRTPSGFTLEEFFTFTGQLKKTRKRRLGQLRHIEITVWGEHNDAFGRQNEAERKASKRAQNTPDSPPTLDGQSTDDTRTEVEYEERNEHEGVPTYTPIVAAWLAQDPLIRHQPKVLRSRAYKSAISKALSVYSEADIVAAISSYALVLSSREHFFDYRWTLKDFLNRGLDRFVPEANPLENFRARVVAQGKDRGVGIADIHRILSEGGSDAPGTVSLPGIAQGGVSEPDAA